MTHDGDLQPFLIEGSANDDTARREEFYEAIRGHYRNAIVWYLSEKEKKGRLSKLLRLISLFLAVLGGAVPLTSAVVSGLNPSIGYILLVFAGGLQLVDKYFGYSSAWRRYVDCAMELNAHLLMFQVEYARLEALQGTKDDRWELLQQYSRQLAEAVSAETEKWSSEFADHMREIEKQYAVADQKR
jgi:hypothetical protein